MKNTVTNLQHDLLRFFVICCLLSGVMMTIGLTAQTPSIGSFGNIVYVERTAAVPLAPTITITGGNSYADSWIEYEITGATSTETLGYTTVGTASTANGVVSIVGTNIYRGNGSTADQIGSVDATHNGLNGAKLRFNFSSPLTNAQFTEPVVGGLIPGWTVYNSAYPNTANLTRTQGRAFTITGSGPYTITRYVGQTTPGSTTGTIEYSFVTDKSYVFGTGCGMGSTHEAWGYEGAFLTGAGTGGWSGTPTLNTSVVADAGATGGQALMLTSSGQVPGSNLTSPCRYGSAFGPYVESSPFTAKSGDALALNWRAAGTQDDYEVYGFIVNTTTNVHTLLFFGKGNTQSWTTSNSTIPADGTYRFLFICGSYDATGGYALGANFFIDNIRVLSSVGAEDAEVQQLARMVTYQNSSCTPTTPRTVTFRARNNINNTGTATANVNITLVNCPPTMTATGQNPNHYEGGAASTLFSSTNITGPETGDNIRELRYTVSNVSNGSNERITIDGTTIPLVAGSGTTSGNSFGYSVSGTSPVTVTLTRATGIATGTMQSIINGMSYSNTTTPPTIGTRSVTLTYLRDDGGTANVGDDDQTFSIVSNVAVYALPVITTNTPTNITINSATLGGNITSDGGTTVTQRGVVYSTSPNPTIGSTNLTSGSGTGTYSVGTGSVLSPPGQQYYCRAYAYNPVVGYVYGQQEIFWAGVAPSFASVDGGVCPGNIIWSTDAGRCDAVVTYSASTPNAIPTPTYTYAFTGATVRSGSGTGSGQIFNRGITNVTITSTNAAGSDQCSFTVTVNDNEPPSWGTTCPGNQALNNIPGDCYATAQWLIPSATDNCAMHPTTPVTFNVSPFTHVMTFPFSNPTDAYGQFPVGVTTITYTAFDAHGNDQVCQFTITVTDNEDPKLLNCPTNITSVPTVPGLCESGIVTWTPPTPSDNCPGFTFTGSHQPNSPFQVGTTTVTYQVVDASLRTVSCSFDIEVVDIEDPVITCPTPDPVYYADAGQCYDQLSFTATATDNCGIDHIKYYVGSVIPNNEIFFPHNFPVGTTTVTAVATDVNGRTADCSFSILVTDDQNPAIVCHNDLTGTSSLTACNTNIISTATGLAYSATPVVITPAEFAAAGTGGSASDNCAITEYSYFDSQSGSCPITVTRTFVVKDAANNTNYCTQTIVIEAPLVTYSQPTGDTRGACEFANQADVNNAFTAWVSAQTAAIGVGGGCSPSINNNSASLNAPALCDGGSTEVTWTITDQCETITLTATWTLTKAPAVTYTEPQDDTRGSCEFANQGAVNTAFADWVTAETGRINQQSGCNPQISNNAPASGPDRCAGGDVMVTWTITDLCETITVTATWTLTAAPAVTYNQPSNATRSACDFANQGAVDAAFTAWVSAQTTAIGVAGGCNPQINNNSSSQTIPPMCGQGVATVTWTITDLCETITLTASWTLTQAPAVTYNQPTADTRSACDFANQGAVNAAFNAWVSAQTTAIDVAGGCSPQINNNSSQQFIPAWCGQGSVTVTWTITDRCETINLSSTWTLTPPPAVTYNQPNDDTRDACDFADQDAVNAAFAAWVSAQTTAINVGGGCDPQIDNNSASLTIPALCQGGSAMVTWTMTDLCETITVTATWTLTAPPAVTYNQPTGDARDACVFADQDDVDAAFNAWVSAQTAAINVGGGCDPQIDNNSASLPIPALCQGGSTMVTWTMTDLCETITVTATWTLIKPDPVTYDAPSGVSLLSCSFADQDAVDDAIASWVTDQTDVIDGSFAGGCSPQVSHNYTTQSIVLCDGGSLTITWTISDLCHYSTETATFILTKPDPVTYDAPIATNTLSCDFANQAAVDADIALWVNTETQRIQANLAGGCNPQVSHNFTTQSIVLCDGGSITITWSITDLCHNSTETATYTLTKPVDLTYTDPAGSNSSSCDYTDQNALDDAIADWVVAQTSIVENSFAGGCDPEVSHNFIAQSIVLCNGGSITITWTISDLCYNNTKTATFTVTKPVDLTYTDPANHNSLSCDYADQQALDAAIANWVGAQTLIVEASFSGGCDPEVEHNYTQQTIGLCDGGSITITWEITDLCHSSTKTATFTLTKPVDLTYDNPANTSTLSCDYADQTALDNAIAGWVSAQTAVISGSFAGGCNPDVDDNYTNQHIDLCDGGSITITWTISDLCHNSTKTATFTLTKPVDLTYDDPSNSSTLSCDYADQAALDAAITAWVQTQTQAVENSFTGGCDPVVIHNFTTQSIALCTGGAITITWEIDDLCYNSVKDATFTLTAPASNTYTTPSSVTYSSCIYASQTAVDAAIADWVSTQTQIIQTSFAGGCVPQVTHDYVAQSIVLCDGGSITITWSITDLCHSSTETATFTLTKPALVTYDAPTGTSTLSCDYADQTALDAAIAAWVNAQTLVVENSFAGGCNPSVSNDFSSQSITLCDGGSITITWSITDDICHNSSQTATFTLTKPVAVTYAVPTGSNTSSCDYADQSALALAVSNWVSAQTDAINSSLSGGCNPQVSHDFANQFITLCDGGSVTITWSIIDDICHSSTQTATFTVIGDNTAPHLVDANVDCSSLDISNQNICLSAADAFDGNTLIAQVEALYADNCGKPLTVTFNGKTAGTTNDDCSWIFTYHYTITDWCSNFVTCDVVYSGGDTESPVINTSLLPAVPVELNANTHNCFASYQWPVPVVSDNCDPTPSLVLTFSDPTITYTTIAGPASMEHQANFPVGTTTVTYTLTDACNHVVTASFEVTVADVTPPTITNMPANITIPTHPGNCWAQLWWWNPPTVTDNCAGVQVSCSHNLGDIFQLGTTPIVYTATDAAGLITTAAFYVTVVDNQPIVLSGTLPGGAVGNVCKDNAPTAPDAAVIAAQYTDNCLPIVASLVGSSVTGNDCAWTATYEYEVHNSNGQYLVPNAIVTITGGDTEAPVVLTMAGALDATLLCDDLTGIADALALHPTASDNCASAPNMNLVSDVTTQDPNCPNAYVRVRTWNFDDGCGNISASFVQTITVIDDVAPVITTAAGDLDATLLCHDQNGIGIALAMVPTATDNCTTAPTIHLVSDVTTPDPNCPNAYVQVRTWNFTDGCGNTSADFVQTIIVIDDVAPVITTTAGDLDATLLCHDQNGIAAALVLVPAATDNCTAVPTLNLVSNVTTQDPNCPNAYVQVRTWNFTDGCVNTSADFVQTITVIDDVAPVITTTAGDLDRTLQCSDAQGIADALLLAPIATDNCTTTPAINLVSDISTPDLTCPNAYVRVRTWNFNDGCGNISSDYLQTITVIDNTAPTFTVPVDLTVFRDHACQYNVLPAVTGEPTNVLDNCDANPAVTYIDQVGTGQCAYDLIITRTWTVTDACGNADSKVQYITVRDNTAPLLTGTLPGGNVGNVCMANRPAAPDVATIAALYSDNCGAVTANQTGTQLTGDDCSWSVIYTYSIMDECGNYAQPAVVTYTGGDDQAPQLAGQLPGGNVGNDCLANAPAAPDAATIAALYTDNCGIVTATLTATQSTGDDCSWTVTYTYSIVDECGNYAQPAVVTYTGGDNEPPQLTGQLPGGNMGNACMANRPAAPDAATMAALYTDNCGTVTANQTGTQLTGDDCSWSVIYTFTIVDECGNYAPNAVVTYTGGDNEPPHLAGTLPTGNFNNVCMADAHTLAPTLSTIETLFTDNCSQTITASLDATNVTGSNTGWTATFTYSVADLCGNTSQSFDVVFTGADITPPTISCSATDPVYLMNNGCFYEVPGVLLDATAADNCELVSLTHNLTGAVDNTTLQGAYFPVGTTQVVWTATDGAGLQTSCTINVVVEGYTVTGNINYYNTPRTPMGGADITLTQGNNLFTTTTDASGAYTLSNVCYGTFEVTFVANRNPGGINATDAGQINAWGATTVKTPLEMVRFRAGDLFRDGVLGGFDAYLTMAYFVTSGANPFAIGPWQFWNADVQTNVHVNPWHTPTIFVNGDQTNNFFAMASADFNGSFIPSGAKTGGDVVLTNNDPLYADPGQVLNLPVTASMDMVVGATSLILEYPAHKVEIIDVHMAGTQIPVTHYAHKGTLRIGWSEMMPMQINNNQDLFVITIKTAADFAKGDAIIFQLAQDPLNEIADDNLVTIPAAVVNIPTIEGTTSVDMTMENLSNITLMNFPNPFSTHTTFAYQIPTDGKVEIAVYDVLGRKAASLVNAHQAQGSYQYTMDTQNLQPGVYTATLTLTTHVGTVTRSIKVISHK